MTIAGGDGQRDQLNQLSSPIGISSDDNDQIIYTADCENARIVKWKANVTNGRIFAAGNGPGNPPNQFSYPGDAIIDGWNNSLIIADEGMVQ